MIKAVVFDMFETLITLFESPLYFGAQMAADAGISEDDFQKIWQTSETDRTVGKASLEDVLEKVCLSFREGLQKPDEAIFRRCLERLNVRAKECLYVGDGGSDELEAAEKIGMRAVQAVWYLKENTTQPSKRKKDFEQIETPLDILAFL